MRFASKLPMVVLPEPVVPMTITIMAASFAGAFRQWLAQKSLAGETWSEAANSRNPLKSIPVSPLIPFARLRINERIRLTTRLTVAATRYHTGNFSEVNQKRSRTTVFKGFLQL